MRKLPAWLAVGISLNDGNSALFFKLNSISYQCAASAAAPIVQREGHPMRPQDRRSFMSHAHENSRAWTEPVFVQLIPYSVFSISSLSLIDRSAPS